MILGFANLVFKLNLSMMHHDVVMGDVFQATNVIMRGLLDTRYMQAFTSKMLTSFPTDRFKPFMFQTLYIYRMSLKM